MEVTSAGKPFQIWAPATGKALAPTVDKEADSISSFQAVVIVITVMHRCYKITTRGHAHFSSVWDFMMGLGKPQRLAKFEVASFIYYGNIRKFVVKNSAKPKWGNPLFWGKLTLPLDSQTQCFLFNVQLLWSYDHSKWVIFLRITAFYNEKF